MELLDVVDEHGVPTGEVVSRDVAHRTGVRHRTSHVWMLRKKNGRLEILAQKRSENKDSHPGCYDISSAGHIPAGEDFVSSALRELEEELGRKTSFTADSGILPMRKNFTARCSRMTRSATFIICGVIKNRRNLCCKKKRCQRCAGLRFRSLWMRWRRTGSRTAYISMSWRWCEKKHKV